MSLAPTTPRTPLMRGEQQVCSVKIATWQRQSTGSIVLGLLGKKPWSPDGCRFTLHLTDRRLILETKRESVADFPLSAVTGVETIPILGGVKRIVSIAIPGLAVNGGHLVFSVAAGGLSENPDEFLTQLNTTLAA